MHLEPNSRKRGEGRWARVVRYRMRLGRHRRACRVVSSQLEEVDEKLGKEYPLRRRKRYPRQPRERSLVTLAEKIGR